MKLSVKYKSVILDRKRWYLPLFIYRMVFNDMGELNVDLAPEPKKEDVA